MSGLWIKFALDGDGGYIATLDDYPGVGARGQSVDEATARLNQNYADLVRGAERVATKRGVTTMQVLDEWKGR
jgi:hypothetical protein